MNRPSCTHRVPTGHEAPRLTCGRLIEAGSFRPAHQPPYSRFKQRRGGRQGAFRRATFKRYGLRCIVCQHPGSPDNPIEAAHDLALDMTEGQQATFEEAQSGVPLCRRCHRRIDAAARRARGRIQP